jgi:CheY-like chemotaxis protein
MIKVLHVDDDRLTYEVTRISLTRFDPELNITWCSSAVEAQSVLANGEYQCVLSDFQMPGMDGLELLQHVRGRYPDMVFIFLTSQGNESKAIEALRGGSNDYFSKDIHIAHFQRLANSIRRHVRAVEERRLREQANHWLTHTSAIIRGMFEAAPVGICIATTAGGIETVNHRFGEIIGLPGDRLLADLDELCRFLEERVIEPKNCAAVLRDVAASGEAYPNLEAILRDGTVVEICLHPLNSGGEATGLLCTCADVTARVLAQQECASMERFLDENHMGIIRMSYEGIVISATRAAAPLLRLWKTMPGGAVPLRLQKAAAHSRRENRTFDFVENIGRQSFLLRVVPFRAGGHLDLFTLNISGESHLQEKLEELRALWDRTLEALEAAAPHADRIAGSSN